jgi:hypothetical protein
VAGSQVVELLLAEAVVERDEGDAGQRCPEQGDGVGQVAGAQVEDGRVVTEAAGGRPGEVEQPGGAERAAVRGDRRAVAARGRHLEDHGDVHENAILQ